MIGTNENYKNAEVKFKFEKADWELFKSKSVEVTLADVQDQNINKKVTDTFLSIARDTIPASKPIKNKIEKVYLGGTNRVKMQ